MKHTHGVIFALILPFVVFATLALAPTPGAGQEAFEECTAGVASGKATTDGRPLLWKTRDAGALDNEVFWNTAGTYHFVSVITAGSPESSWMGVNEKGFAIINTVSSDLTAGTSGPGNGDFMATALASCATVAEFQALLDATNESGRRTATNYGVIDATGAAAFFETAGHRYWRYDAANTEKGYILRTNFAINGARDSLHARPYSMDRYLETDELMRGFFLTDGIDFKEIAKVQVRSFGDTQGHLVPLPITGSYDGHTAGYYPNSSSINRNSSVSFAVIQGVLAGEDATLSTMWTILGQPSTGILVPYWPVGATPAEADGPKTAPLDDVANHIRDALYAEPGAKITDGRPLFINTRALRDENGDGIWKITMPVEDSIVSESERRLAGWRASGPDVGAMLQTERTMAARAVAALERAYAYLMDRR
ncbi:MAG: C45 family peptidase [Gemmatimonadetes bacterium]|nr:C45 family peptidase [Gemmatimonadota bacterium]